jgi:hypothetical protein
MTGADPDHPRFSFEARRPMTATVAIGWSPKWRARVDGRPVPLGPTGDYLMAVALPPGRHALALDFGTDRWDRVGRALSLGALVAGAGSLLGLRRRW